MLGILEELFSFLEVNKNSYYSIILNFFDLVQRFNTFFLYSAGQEDEQDSAFDYYNSLKSLMDTFENLLNLNNMNQ